jgi:hypothetical protein
MLDLIWLPAAGMILHVQVFPLGSRERRKTLLVADLVVCRYEANPSIVSHAHPKKMPLSQNSRVLHVLIHRLLNRPKVRISSTFNRVTVEEGASYSKAPSHHADHLRMR